MALKDKNHYENNRKLNILQGGNGDYTIQISGIDEEGLNTVQSFEVCMSGGYASHAIKMAVLKLFEALEEEGLNDIEI